MLGRLTQSRRNNVGTMCTPQKPNVRWVGGGPLDHMWYYSLKKLRRRDSDNLFFRADEGGEDEDEGELEYGLLEGLPELLGD